MNYRVLIVEDDKIVRDDIVATLQKHGHTADVASNGTEGYNLATSKFYDILIIDRNLNESHPFGVHGNGFDLIRKLRENPDFKNPILVLSAFIKDKDDKIGAYESGTSDYLEKPYSKALLMVKINALVHLATPTKHNLISVGELELNVKNKTLHRNSNEIPLTKIELGILEVLMRNPKAFLNRRDFVAEVWVKRGKTSPDSNTVDTHICRLRAKIGEELIESARGLGYRLVA